MEKLFRKKSFLEIYIPIGIVVGALIALFTGFSLALSFVLGILVAMIGYVVFLKRKAV